MLIIIGRLYRRWRRTCFLRAVISFWYFLLPKIKFAKPINIPFMNTIFLKTLMKMLLLLYFTFDPVTGHVSQKCHFLNLLFITSVYCLDTLLTIYCTNAVMTQCKKAGFLVFLLIGVFQTFSFTFPREKMWNNHNCHSREHELTGPNQMSINWGYTF